MEKVNRKYKDSVFRMYFGHNREALLSIYNALNGTDYSDPEALEVNTLKNAIYMGMYNDISFVLGTELNLYEHQSTVNPNIPLRNLFYAADLLQEMTDDMDIYGHKKLIIPAPRFVVFYNGEEKQPGRRIYKLSELYSPHTGDNDLELIVNVININPGYNSVFLDKCQPLKDYSEFVRIVRLHRSRHKLEEAMEMAIDECIRKNIMKDFLKKNLLPVCVWQHAHTLQKKQQLYVLL